MRLYEDFMVKFIAMGEMLNPPMPTNHVHYPALANQEAHTLTSQAKDLVSLAECHLLEVCKVSRS
jgi:hypothetical protein